MIVGDLNLEPIVTAPHKADSVLVIDPNAVVSLAVAPKFFQPISRGRFQVVHCDSSVKHC